MRKTLIPGLLLSPLLDIDFNDLSGAQATEDRTKDADRDDDLEYTSPPLATACEILGPIEAHLFVSTDAADTDFVASIYRLTPDGKRFVVHSGIQRLRYAADRRLDKPVVATNTVYHDGSRQSYLRLPVGPREDAPGLSFASQARERVPRNWPRGTRIWAVVGDR